MKKFISRMGNPTSRVLLACLALAVAMGVFSMCASPASATSSYFEPYLEKVVSWDVMRGDLQGNLNADLDITRAEFVAMVNRAYGYSDVGDIPFTDVKQTDWYYDDIRIAYNVGYFKGTSETTASPNDTLTREQAAVILARNMKLEETTGEVLGFSDSRSLGDWSRNLIQSLVDVGVITGYSDGTFQPQKSVSRGEVATMIVRAIGTPVQSEGEYTLGDVYGNVTITSSNVKLKNTNIVGDLYITGGVELGTVQLQNVKVSGKIIISGGGESESADTSILLQNVKADEMLVDSIIDKFVTVRAEGTTTVGTTTVRTTSYLDDATTLSAYGLKQINIDAGDKDTVYLAGYIKTARNLTPNSNLVLAQGTANAITVDEKATNSTLTINNGATALAVNLDTATTVTGEGDITTLNVNAADCKVSMLPDKITVRPGITAEIYGEVMDTVAAEESSSYPNILSSYPAVKDIAPTSAQAVFSTNKKGTLYWAVTAKVDGTPSMDDLISPPSYGGKILASGSITVTASNTEMTVPLTGLASDSEYRISAVLVDNRDQRSAIKIKNFTTPDDSVPGFATGYPEVVTATKKTAQVALLPTKSCQLYYVLLPHNATAPKATEFKAKAFSGNYGMGSLDVTKNVSLLLQVNTRTDGVTVGKDDPKEVTEDVIDETTGEKTGDTITYVPLEEQVTYDLYLWLTDYDGAKSSEVMKVTLTTVDETPPEISRMDQTDAQISTIGLTTAVNEPSTIYWVIVKEDGDFFRKLTSTNDYPELTDWEAKVQVQNGMGAIQKGSVTVAAADTDVIFTISALDAQTSYDLYYVAKDTAGNYSAQVEKLNIHTLDNTPPTATQEFTKLGGGENAGKPMPDTDIRLVFSESVQGYTNSDCAKWKDLQTAIDDAEKAVTAAEKAITSAAADGEAAENDEAKAAANTKKSEAEAEKTTAEKAVTAAREALAAELQEHITMYQLENNNPVQVTERTAKNEDSGSWTIDYRYAEVSMEDGKMIVTFPTDDTNSALNLNSGAKYYFVIDGIADTAVPANKITTAITLETFTTVYAQVILNEYNPRTIDTVATDYTPAETDVRVDIGFEMKPQSTGSAADTDYWDLMFWSDTPVTFELYYRKIQNGTSSTSTVAWQKMESNQFQTVDKTDENGDVVKDTNGKTVTESVPATEAKIVVTAGQEYGATSMGYSYNYSTAKAYQFEKLNDLDSDYTYQYAIHFTSVGVDGLVNQPDKWGATVNMKIGVAAGSDMYLSNLDANVPDKWDSYVKAENIHSIGLAYTNTGTDDELVLEKTFIDQTPPSFDTGYPLATTIRSDSVTMSLILDRDATVYYALVPDGYVTVETTGNAEIPVLADGKYNTETKKVNTTATLPSAVSPNADRIIYQQLNQDVSAFGSIQCTGGMASTIDVSGLRSETTYYAFFVLKGSAAESYSQVLVGQFKTDKVEVPKIFLTNQNPAVNISTDATAHLYYQLINKEYLPKIFTEPFHQNLNTAGDDETKKNTSVGTSIAHKGTADADHTDCMTVIQAMINGPSSGGQSYFDMYASNDLRREVQAHILGEYNTDKTGGGSDIYTQADVSQLVDFSNVITSSGTQYYLLATALHVNADINDVEAYGFKAVSNVYLPDNVAPSFKNDGPISAAIKDNIAELPVINETTGKVTGYKDVLQSTWCKEPENYTYSGTFTLVFDKNVYYWADNGSRYAVVMQNDPSSDTTATVADDQVSVMTLIDNKKFSVETKTTEAGTTFTFSFSHISNGERLVLFNKGRIGNSTDGVTSKQLVLTFNTSLVQSDYGNKGTAAMPGFTYSWN